MTWLGAWREAALASPGEVAVLTFSRTLRLRVRARWHLRSVLQLPIALSPPTMALLHSGRVLSGIAAAFHPGVAAAASARAR